MNLDLTSNGRSSRRWWQRIEVWGVVVAVSAAAALIVVISTRDVDALAAIALALAVFTFISQVILMIADLNESNRRDRDVMSVNSQTRELLARIEGQTSSTERLVHEQFGKVVDQLIIVAKPLADQPETEENAQIVAALETLRTQAVAPIYDQAQGATHSYIVTTWPNEMTVAQLVGGGIRDLDELAYPLLDILAMDVISAYQRKQPEGRVLNMPQYAGAARELIEKGYAREDGVALILTMKGLQAASLINKQGSPPEYVLQQWPELLSVRSKSQH